MIYNNFAIVKDKKGDQNEEKSVSHICAWEISVSLSNIDEDSRLLRYGTL